MFKNIYSWEALARIALANFNRELDKQLAASTSEVMAETKAKAKSGFTRVSRLSGTTKKATKSYQRKTVKALR